MALITCPECSKQISDQSKICIHCGYPLKTQTNFIPKQSFSVIPKATEQNKSIHYRKSLLITACILITVLILILAVLLYNHHIQTQRYSRDLGKVFDFNFSMDMDHIIEYEAKTFGNTEHYYDPENNRLDFAVCLDGEDKEYKHRYFFDENTGLLTSVYYMDALVSYDNKSDSSVCEHVEKFVDDIIDYIGDWDKKPQNSLFKECYVKINGVKCTITYQDGSHKALFIHSK